MEKGKILVTPRSLSKHGHPLLEQFTKAGYQVVYPSPGVQPGEEELIKNADRVVGYLAGVEKISRRFIEAATDLKAISRNGVGIDNIDLAAAEEHEVKVLKAVGANSRGVAELAFGHLLAAARSIMISDSTIKEGEWTREKGIELEGRTLGLLGCGMIGQIVARFALAFGMNVLAYDPFPDPLFLPGKLFEFTNFSTLIEKSDAVSLHCPPGKDGYVIDRGVIEKMKDGVIIVNTSRAGLVDERAVIEALNSGKVRSFTCDVFAVEPPDDWSLAKHARVLATPHIGGFTQESVHRAARTAIENLLMELEGFIAG